MRLSRCRTSSRPTRCMAGRVPCGQTLCVFSTAPGRFFRRGQTIRESTSSHGKNRSRAIRRRNRGHAAARLCGQAGFERSDRHAGHRRRLRAAARDDGAGLYTGAIQPACEGRRRRGDLYRGQVFCEKPGSETRQRQEISSLITRTLREQGGETGSFRIDIGSAPYMVFYRLLNPGSPLQRAWQVSLYSIADSIAKQRLIFWRIVGIGSVILLLGLGVSHLLSTRAGASCGGDCRGNRRGRGRAGNHRAKISRHIRERGGGNFPAHAPGALSQRQPGGSAPVWLYPPRRSWWEAVEPVQG